jgi:sugar phosphate isomerase/epimerase
MSNRRSFLKTTGALAAASLLPGLSRGNTLFTGLAANYPPVGLQTYSLGVLLNNKELSTKDVLKQIADIGVKELETATGSTTGLYYGHKAKEFAAMVNDLGMKWIGNHVGGLPRAPRPAGENTRPAPSPEVAAAMAAAGQRTNLRDNLQQIVDEAAENGCTWVMCASSAISTLDEIKQTTEIFVKAGEAARKNGMKFAYHNHQSEFDKIEGVSAYDYVLGNTSKDEVFMEIDLAWSTQAGMDPVEMFKQYPGRFPLWHVKDIDPATNRPTSVGKGKVDFKRIFTNSQLSGVQHTFIEQDGARSITDIADSVNWLKSNIYV